MFSKTAFIHFPKHETFEISWKVRLGNFNFNPADWKNVSDSFRELLFVFAISTVAMLCHVPMLPIHQFQLGRHTQHRSDDAKSLIRWMLKMNPRDRYTAEHRPQCQECRIWYFIYIYIQRFVDHHDKSAKEIRQTKLCRQALNHEWIKNKAPRAQSVSLTQLDCMLTGLRRCIGRPETNLVEQEASNVHSEGTAIFAIPLFFSQFVVVFFQER